MAVIDLVKWDSAPGIFVWKYPSDELSTLTQLIVSESQQAILLKDGKLIGIFGAGRYTLDTNNIPFLSTFIKMPFGGHSPFKAEVWFVNKAITLDVKWGTPDPIQLMDPKYQVMLPVRAFGQFGVQIENGAKFLLKIVGTLSRYDSNSLMAHFKGIVITKVKDSIAKKLVKEGISILEVNASLSDISDFLQSEIEGDMAEFGVQLMHFKVLSINTPENDPAVQKLKSALAKKAEMNIIGYSYQQERSFNALESAAGNQGSGGSLMGAGIGMGVGLGMGGQMGRASSEIAQQMQVSPPRGTPCPKCGTSVPDTTKFCSGCGFSMVREAPKEELQKLVCDVCGTIVLKGTKFCPKCGEFFNLCSKCGTRNKGTQPNCQQCGSLLPVRCPHCGAIDEDRPRFCSDCGKEVFRPCPKCHELIAPNMKFCTQCGTSIQ